MDVVLMEKQEHLVQIVKAARASTHALVAARTVTRLVRIGLS